MRLTHASCDTPRSWDGARTRGGLIFEEPRKLQLLVHTIMTPAGTPCTGGCVTSGARITIDPQKRCSAARMLLHTESANSLNRPRTQGQGEGWPVLQGACANVVTAGWASPLQR